jgi:integrase
VFTRPGELRLARWEEFDLDGAEPMWRIPTTRMKMRREHHVPLAPQVVELLRAQRTFSGHCELVFPSPRSIKRPLSDMALLAALRRLGYDKAEVSPHGFRATARTILDEVLHQRVDLIEHQLAHIVKDPNRRAYARATFLSERRAMMTLWANYLDGLRAEAAKRAQA